MPAVQTPHGRDSATQLDGPPTPEEIDSPGVPAQRPKDLAWSQRAYFGQMLARGFRELDDAPPNPDRMGLAAYLDLAQQHGLLELRPNTKAGGSLMVNTETHEVRAVGPWVADYATQIRNAVAVRKLARSGTIHVCELANPEHIAEVAEADWTRFCDSVKSNEYQPDVYGNIAVLRIERRDAETKPIITTLVNYQLFTHAIREGRFETLPRAEIGCSFGKWMTASTII